MKAIYQLINQIMLFCFIFLEQVFCDYYAVEYVCFCTAVLPDDGVVRPKTCRSFLKY